jgi:hypothetical protein
LAGEKAGGRPVGTHDLLVAIMRSDESGEWHRIWLHCGDDVDIAANPVRDTNCEPAGAWAGIPLTRMSVHALDVSKRLSDRYRFSPLPVGILALGLVADHASGASRALGRGIGRGELLVLLQDAILGVTLNDLESLLPKLLAESRTADTDPVEPQRGLPLPPSPYLPSSSPAPSVQHDPLIRYLEDQRRSRKERETMALTIYLIIAAPFLLFLLYMLFRLFILRG